MENIKINKNSVIEKLTGILVAIEAKTAEARESNKNAILDGVEYVVSNDDAFTTSGSTKKIKVKTFGHLKTRAAEVTRRLNLYNLAADEQLEFEQYEAEELSELLNAEVELVEIDATAAVSVRRA